MPRLALLIALAGCAKPTPKAEEVVGIEPGHGSCEYAYTELPFYVPPSHQQHAPIVQAHGTARRHHAAGTQAITDHKAAVAADEFMACARAYAGIEDADPERGLAQKSAELCIGDATYAYATAGKLAAVGKAALEKLAADDPRLAAAIEARLAKAPADCP